MANTYGVGNGIKVSVRFRNTDTGQLVDPALVVIHVKDPALAITTLTYLVDAALQKTAVGCYYTVIDANAAGTWKYRWEGTITNQAAAENTFTITASTF